MVISPRTIATYSTVHFSKRSFLNIYPIDMTQDHPSFDDIPCPEIPTEWTNSATETSSENKPKKSSAPTDFKSILKTYWGYDDFRGIQSEIIQSIASGNDTLGLMPTGGGKSIAFQVPALSMKGVCIVITPLIALMKDQVDHLRKRGIGAAAIYSGQSRDEILRHLDNSIFGAYKFLYVSPERIATPIFQTKLKRMQVCFITVDEAHCISQWGYDFRPSYLNIAEIRKQLPGVHVLALTATATPAVVTDICEKLTLPDDFGNIKNTFSVLHMSFARPNLRYIVRKTNDKYGELVHILKSVQGSTIVYTRSRKGTREVCQELEKEGFSALFYHAGLTDVEKDVRQHAWQEDETRIMVATNAFGMGIDKPDVRLVIHMDLPDSIEAYFQEAGRGGRDGETAYAVLLYNNSDHGKMLRRIDETFPPKEYVQKVYDNLAYYFQLAIGDGFNVTYEFNLPRFCTTFKLFPVPVVSALNILTRAGYIEYREEEENTSRVYFIVERDELYNFTRLSSLGDRVIRALLRHYCGLFCDYVYIDESLLAKDCDATENEIYHTLVQLTHQRILHYVPRKRTPYVTYLTRRVDGNQIYLTQEIYEQRKVQYINRVESILDYATEDDFCRSRFLLEYFGDKTGKDCGGCDVCIAQKSTVPVPRQLREEMLKKLSDQKFHHPADLRIPPYSTEDCIEMLQNLLNEECVVFQDGRYKLAEQ